MEKPPTRRNRRLSMRRPLRGKARVQCYKGTMDLGKNLAISLQEVSESGARLTVCAELPARQEVTLCLEGQCHLRPVKIAATVVWCRAAGEERFLIGVRFEKYLDYKDYLSLT